MSAKSQVLLADIFVIGTSHLLCLICSQPTLRKHNLQLITYNS